MRFPMLLAALLAAGCGSGGGDAAPASAEAVQFVAFGDSGNATPNQAAVGEAMGKVCAERGCDLALMLGDNFYASGVTSVDDEQFQSKFTCPTACMATRARSTASRRARRGRRPASRGRRCSTRPCARAEPSS